MKVCFDFDKTLTKRDTLIGFYKYCADSKVTFYLKIAIYFFFAICYKLKLIDNEQLKRNGLKLFLRHLNLEEYKSHSLSYGRSLVITDLLLTLNKHLKNGHEVYIVTASFVDYVKEAFRDYELNVIGSDIIFSEGKISDLKKNCFGKEKVQELNEIGIEELNLLYTDSLDDRPLMNISDKVYLVKYKRNKMELIEITS